jgi:hypothetical protein
MRTYMTRAVLLAVLLSSTAHAAGVDVARIARFFVSPLGQQISSESVMLNRLFEAVTGRSAYGRRTSYALLERENVDLMLRTLENPEMEKTAIELERRVRRIESRIEEYSEYMKLNPQGVLREVVSQELEFVRTSEGKVEFVNEERAMSSYQALKSRFMATGAPAGNLLESDVGLAKKISELRQDIKEIAVANVAIVDQDLNGALSAKAAKPLSKRIDRATSTLKQVCETARDKGYLSSPSGTELAELRQLERKLSATAFNARMYDLDYYDPIMGSGILNYEDVVTDRAQEKMTEIQLLLAKVR